MSEKEKSTASVDLPRPKPKSRGKRSLSPEARAKRTQSEINKRLSRLKKDKLNVNYYIRSTEKRQKNLHDLDDALKGNTNKGLVLNKDIYDDAQDSALYDIVADAEVVFKPNDGPQTTFFESSEQEVLYGGAAGGGKSIALIVDAARDAWHPQHKGLIVRRTLDELRDLIAKSKEFYPKMYPGCRFTKDGSTWYFNSGATVWYTYSESDDDVTRFQGHEFNYIGCDELTQWSTPFTWNYLRSRLRSTSGLRTLMRASANPGGVGGNWVKRMFIDPAPAGDAFWATDPDTGRVLCWPDKDLNGQTHKRAGEPLFRRRFIPARLSDNPYYANGDYEANLLSLPEAQRRQLLEGSWDIIDGAAFPEFNRAVHVVKPFRIPDNWVKFRACDYGYSSPACVLWMTMDYDGRFYVYRELYGKGMDIEVLPGIIKNLEEGERVTHGVLDSSVWSRRGEVGPSPAEEMNKRGMRWRPSDRSPGSRVAGKLELHKRLRIPPSSYLRDHEGNLTEIPAKPMVQIFEGCTNLIRTLPMLPLDKRNLEDVDTDAEDHAYDALRYGLMSRPMRPDLGLNIGYQARVTPVHPRAADPSFGY